MKNIRILRKCIAILAFSVCSMVSAFAQGAVIAYAENTTITQYFEK